MEEASIRKTIYISVVVLAVVLFAGIALLRVFLWLPLQEMKATYQENRIAFSEVQNKALRVQELKGELQTINEDKEVLESALLSDEEKLAFLEEAERLASATRNEYSVKNATEVKRNGLEVLELSVSTRGSFTDTVRFLNRLRALPYVITVRAVNLSGITDGGIVQSAITIDVFMR